ncbi:Mechanosensitive ion channel protein MscS (fragment) [Tenacibaculum xiamenense]
MVYILTSAFSILIISGIDFKQVGLFASSILAILGVGIFAQWSILSNLTASVILFFHHLMHIGDTIKILYKEFDLT